MTLQQSATQTLGGKDDPAHTPNMGPQFLEQDVGRDFEDNVGNEENSQGRIVFCSFRDSQIRGHA